MLRKELQIHTFQDLLEHFPYRHVDKTEVKLISEINFKPDYIQVSGTLLNYEMVGAGRGKRLVAEIRDQSGVLELTWFQGINWVENMLEKEGNILYLANLAFLWVSLR